MSAQPTTDTQPVTVKAEDLPVYCPGPKAPLWSMHPRVYIELAHSGTAACPYCGTTYQLQHNH